MQRRATLSDIRRHFQENGTNIENVAEEQPPRESNENDTPPTQSSLESSGGNGLSKSLPSEGNFDSYMRKKQELEQQQEVEQQQPRKTPSPPVKNQPPEPAPEKKELTMEELSSVRKIISVR